MTVLALALFQDCGTTAEPSALWKSVVTNGGSKHGLADVMPASGEAFPEEEISAASSRMLPLLLFLRGDPDKLRPPRVRDRLGARAGRPRIRCPACGWEPRRDDQWSCVCHYSWNTFDTGGVCPSCDRQWTETQCPKCHVWSRHQDWYADGGDDQRVRA